MNINGYFLVILGIVNSNYTKIWHNWYFINLGNTYLSYLLFKFSFKFNFKFNFKLILHYFVIYNSYDQLIIHKAERIYVLK